MAKKLEEPMPDLRNATVSHLVDETAKLREELSKLKGLEAYYTTALKSRMIGNRAEGELYVAGLDDTSQERINSDKCRQLLDAETLAKVTMVSTFTTLRFSKKPQAQQQPNDNDNGVQRP